MERSTTPDPPAASSWPAPGSLPDASVAAGLGEGATSPSSLPSSFSAFNLPQPRQHHPPPSPGPMQIDTSSLEDWPLYHRRLTSNPASSPSSTSASPSFASPNQPFLPVLPFSALPFRKQSMLGFSEPLLPPATLSPAGDSDEEDDDDDDAAMVLGSPGFDQMMAPLPPFHPLIIGQTRQSRSRSTSESQQSMQSSHPASPVLIARALAGQRTPPPFLQRRLYNEMQEDDASGSNSPGGSSGSGSVSGVPPPPTDLAEPDDDEERDSVSMGLGLAVGANGGGSGSGSGSEENSGRVRSRPVSRKPNLLPKPKSHLRVLADLRNEDGPADQLEIASEATLHRLSRSGASTVPALRSTPAVPLASTPEGGRPPSSHGLPSRPTPNRFPEQANEDDEHATSSGDEDGDEGGEAGSDWGGMSLGGYGTEDEEERRASIWTGIRGAGMGGPGMSTASASAGGKSPGSERGRMEIETNSPSTPGWHASARPGKRKMTADERFEPYSQAFKRRAVSPASGGSPILSFHQAPPPTSLSLPPSHTLPIPIPSPTLGPHHSFFSNINGGRRSRAGSPVASSLSSSAGRPGGWVSGSQALGMVMSGRAERDEERAGSKASEAGDALGSMSLG